MTNIAVIIMERQDDPSKINIAGIDIIMDVI